MAAYLDSSAIVKLVVREAESAALRRFLRSHPIRTSSALARVEVRRSVRGQGDAADERARQVLGRLVLMAIDDDVLEGAARLDAGVLRSLDAIHLATALQLAGDLAVIASYDRRMLEAAESLGLPTESPG